MVIALHDMKVGINPCNAVPIPRRNTGRESGHPPGLGHILVDFSNTFNILRQNSQRREVPRFLHSLRKPSDPL